MFMAQSKRKLHLVPHLFFPLSCEGRKSGTLSDVGPVLPITYFITSIPENGKRMWLLWKHEDNEWQQAVEKADYFQPSSVFG